MGRTNEGLSRPPPPHPPPPFASRPLVMPPLVGARHPRFRGRLPVIGRPNADILPSFTTAHPPPAYDR